jgi:uncharacterized repeat protein (TIGR03803 family)
MRSTRLNIAASVAAACVAVLLAAQSTQAQTYTVLHTFFGRGGRVPVAGVIQDAEGNLYGTTAGGGAPDLGTVFKLSKTGKFTVLHSFAGGSDGAAPDGGVIRDASGNLYGTTAKGGAGNLGTVFEVDTTGKETVLFSFGGLRGRQPVAGVIQDAEGNLYGTTSQGGANLVGTVFKLSKTGKETVLYNFCSQSGCADGYSPRAGVIRDSQGNLYGTTSLGGNNQCNEGCGTVFKLSRTGKLTVLYAFQGNTNGQMDGSFPVAGVILDASGNIYGTTAYGGNPTTNCGADRQGCGIVFKLDKTGKETVLYRFMGEADSQDPQASLLRDAKGNLYGTTFDGGGSGGGTVFKLSEKGTETVLYHFTTEEGYGPAAGLIQDANGNFFGTAAFGAKGEAGVVFQLTP